MPSSTTILSPPPATTRDVSVGAALLAAGGGTNFVHDVDLVVPVARGSQARVAFAFDKKHLASCCGLIRDCDATVGVASTLPLDFPEAHAQSVGPLLRSLVPPGKLPELPPPLMSDVLQTANWLALEPTRLAGLRTAYQKSLNRLTPADMTATLSHCDNSTLSLAVDAVAKLLADDLDARSYVPNFDAAGLAAVLQSPCLTIHEDSAFALVKTWCEAQSQPGDSVAHVLRANKLQSCLRWHEMSESLLDASAEMGCLSAAEFEEVVAVRALPRPRCGTVDMKAFGSQFLPRQGLEPIHDVSWCSPHSWVVPAPWRFLTTTHSTTQFLRWDSHNLEIKVDLGPEGITLGRDNIDPPYRWRDLQTGVWSQEFAFKLRLTIDGKPYDVTCTFDLGPGHQVTVAWPQPLAATHRLLIQVPAPSAKRTFWQRVRWRVPGKGRLK